MLAHRNRSAESGVLLLPTSPLLLVVPTVTQQRPLLFEPSRPNNFSHTDLSVVTLMTFNVLAIFFRSEKIQHNLHLVNILWGQQKEDIRGL